MLFDAGLLMIQSCIGFALYTSRESTQRNAGQATLFFLSHPTTCLHDDPRRMVLLEIWTAGVTAMDSRTMVTNCGGKGGEIGVLPFESRVACQGRNERRINAINTNNLFLDTGGV